MNPTHHLQLRFRHRSNHALLEKLRVASRRSQRILHVVRHAAKQRRPRLGRANDLRPFLFSDPCEPQRTPSVAHDDEDRDEGDRREDRRRDDVDPLESLHFEASVRCHRHEQ